LARVTLLSARFPDLLPMRGRSPGVHVSDVIRGICVRLGYFDEHKDLSTAWAQLGQAHEQAIINRLTRHYPGRYEIPGELECDGLYLTPDLVDLNPTDYSDFDVPPTATDLAVMEEDRVAVEEVKLSWMSAKWVPGVLLDRLVETGTGIPRHGDLPDLLPGVHLFDGDDKLWRYITQAKCYCWAVRTRVGRVRVMHVNGFNDGNGPQPYVHQWVWDTIELAENWQFILSNARQYHGLGGGRSRVVVPAMPVSSTAAFKIKGAK
jgi:hypothetical protein